MQAKREQIEVLIRDHAEVFQDAFMNIDISDEKVKRAEQTLGLEIPESYLWFLKQYGHGVTMIKMVLS